MASSLPQPPTPRLRWHGVETILFVLLFVGCQSLPNHEGARVLKVGLSDDMMRKAAQELIVGANREQAEQLLQQEGFQGFSLISKPSEPTEVWCMREDPVENLIVKKWNLVFRLDSQGEVSDVSMSSGLVGP